MTVNQGSKEGESSLTIIRSNIEHQINVVAFVGIGAIEGG